MGIEKCTKNNRPGYRCGGPENPCYTYTPNNSKSREMQKQKAIDQCLAQGKSPSEMSEEEQNKKVIELKPADMDTDKNLLISSVNQPAIEEDFVFFNSDKNKENKYELSELDEEKRIITGPAMIPDRQIYRMDEQGNEYYVYFSKETVMELSQRLISNCRIGTSIEHEMEVEDVHLAESWIVEDPDNDKANKFGFNSTNINEGTWMVSYKCNNDEFWKKVKEGELKGLSIEGYFVENFNEHSFEKSTEDECEECPEGDPELDEIFEIIRQNYTDEEDHT